MNRSREITVAAVVALIGSLLFISFGALLWLFAHHVALWRARNYPGMTYHDPVILTLKSILTGAIAISIVVGLIGIVTSIGLFRMWRWARISMIAWCVASSLACVLGLVYPGPGSEFHINPVFPLTLMLVIFPVNTWWLLLFFRRSTKARFGILPPAQITRRIGMKEFLNRGWIMTAAVLALLGAGLVWAGWRASPMREVERSKEAVAEAKSWHYHTVRYFENLPPETDDADFVCPVFRHSIAETTKPDGSPLNREDIVYFSRSYNHIGDQWVLSEGRQGGMNGQAPAPILECQDGPIGLDETALPYNAILSDGSVRRGDVQDVEGESCRDYDIAVPTPHDPTETEFRFSMCINESDHLPRETRRTPPGSDHERVTAYTQWNALSEPQLPAGFPR